MEQAGEGNPTSTSFSRWEVEQGMLNGKRRVTRTLERRREAKAWDEPAGNKEGFCRKGGGAYNFLLLQKNEKRIRAGSTHTSTYAFGRKGKGEGRHCQGGNVRISESPPNKGDVLFERSAVGNPKSWKF